MNDYVTLSHDSEDGLSQVIWTFYRLNDKLVVDSYTQLSRETKRMKFKRTKGWLRLTNSRENSILIEDVPLTPEIQAEALEGYIANIREKLTVNFQRS